MLAASRQGIGQGIQLVDGTTAGPQAQMAARELGLRRLTPNQENAARLLLSSKDRVVAVQGVAGAGKSAVLAPVAAIARAQGHPVIGLAIAGVVVRDLKDKAGIEASTVAGFIARYERVIDGNASPKQATLARETLRGALVLVDESSMVGTDQMSRLIAIANTLEVGRLALIGDTRQLGAVEAGKPFAELQRDGTPTAQILENLRARSEVMKETAAALNGGDLARAFEILSPVTQEASRGGVPKIAVGIWASLPASEREQTLLLASGRAMRTAANAEAQASLKDLGELGTRSVTLDVLDRIIATKEGARDVRAYKEGYVVEWRTNLPRQGIERGDIGTVIGVEDGKVSVRMRDGRTRLFEPGRLPANLRHDAVTISAIKQIALHEGDRIRLTEGDKARDVNNADLARVEAIGENGITIAMLNDGVVHDLKHGDRLLERLDLAYALNAHIAQGVTAEHGIVMMSAAERKLASAQSFLVNMTRIVDKATLVVDSGRQLEQAITRNSGEKTSALDVAGRDSPVSDGQDRPWRSVSGITYAHLEAAFATREDRAEAKYLLDREASDRKWATSLPAGIVQLDPPMKLQDVELQITLGKEQKSMDISI
jgi:ATP-dependent exoDNAse (exonuclease V) alpha subunit